MTLRIPLERSRSFNRNLTENVQKQYGNMILAQACIGYAVPQTLILIGIFAGCIIVVSFIVIIKSHILPSKPKGK